MRIALDLDGTVIRGPIPFPLEPAIGGFKRWFYPKEELREGIVELAKAIREAGFELWVYTSSFRKPRYIKRLFGKYGIRLDGIVNQTLHNEIATQGIPSKFPPAFGIDLLIDDSVGVMQEGEKWGFSVLVIEPRDRFWVGKVMEVMVNG